MVQGQNERTAGAEAAVSDHICVRAAVAEIVDSNEGQDKHGLLIPVLQGFQKRFGYLPEQAILEIGRQLQVPVSEIYGVITFYTQFRLVPAAKNVIKVCEGTACHVRGGAQILETVERELGVKAGETTEDFEYTVERVACIGACALAPTMVINEDVHGPLTPKEARELLGQKNKKGGQQ